MIDQIWQLPSQARQSWSILNFCPIFLKFYLGSWSPNNELCLALLEKLAKNPGVTYFLCNILYKQNSHKEINVLIFCNLAKFVTVRGTCLIVILGQLLWDKMILMKFSLKLFALNTYSLKSFKNLNLFTMGNFKLNFQ